MDRSYSKCPKCGHEPPEALPANASCPACGIYFFKWSGQSHPSARASADAAFDDEARSGIASLFQPLDGMARGSFLGRCAALAMLGVWSAFLIGYDYRTAEINASFMHNILLPIHEAGHILFMPLGEFMTILGGSLFQVALPLGIAIAFIKTNRDNFGAALAAWWGSVSVVDVSAYIYDALHPQMVLLGGHTGEDGPHDWIYLLNSAGQLHHAQGLGMLAHTGGAMLMIAALAWAGTVLWRQREVLEQ